MYRIYSGSNNSSNRDSKYTCYKQKGRQPFSNPCGAAAVSSLPTCLYRPGSVGTKVGVGFHLSYTLDIPLRVQSRKIIPLPIYRSAVMTESLYIIMSESGLSSAEVCDM